MGSPLTRNGEADQGQPGPQTARRTRGSLARKGRGELPWRSGACAHRDTRAPCWCCRPSI